MTPVIIEGSEEDKAFREEKESTLELWDNLTKVLLEDDEARFVAATGKPTKQGARIVKGVMVPLVREYPELVVKRVKGKPVASFPIKREDWRTNGLVVLGWTAERLLGLDYEEIAKVADLEDPEPLLEWAKEHVPELADDHTTDEVDY